MKLRNKKTGGMGEAILCNLEIYVETGDRVYCYVKNINKFCKEWECVKPAEPLIKDEKVRKAVRAWAEANGVPNDVPLDVFEYLGTGLTVMRYHYEAKTKPYERCVQFEYISRDEIYAHQNDREHTIDELCGEEEK